jgi:FkbM family methyltransferase
MSIISRTTSRLHTLAGLIEHPKLFWLRQKGGYVGIFSALDRPWFHDLQIATVIDIGANQGQFSITMSELLPDAKILAFEPLPDCFATLQQKMQGVSNFTGFNVALGDSSGRLTFEQNIFSPSSSFLPMSSVHKKLFPYADSSEEVSVKVELLDDFYDQLKIIEPLFIKVDVQGYEDKVLRGGSKIFQQAKLVMIETSFQELYEGQPLFDDIHKQMKHWGFSYVGSLAQSHNPLTGEVIQADSLYLKC